MGLISYWNPGPGENCTANAIIAEFSIPIVLKHAWCSAVLEPNYRDSKNFKSADYLVINFNLGDKNPSAKNATIEQLQERAKTFKYILLEVLREDQGQGDKRYRFIFKFTETLYDAHKFRECVEYMSRIFRPVEPNTERNAVHLWGPGKRVLATNKDGVNIDPEVHAVYIRRYF